VFYDASHLRDAGATTVSFAAIVNDLSGHLGSDSVVDVGVEFVEPPAAPPGYALVHYNRPAGDYDAWGLQLSGDAIDPSEVTDPANPKPFLGEDEYGRFAFIKLARDDAPVIFIVHSGDTTDPPDSPDRSFDPAAAPEIWLRQDDPTVYASQAEAQGYATVHYACTDCSAVIVEATGPAGAMAVTRLPDDDYGAVFTLAPPDLASAIAVRVLVGGVVDIDGQVFTPTETPTAWFQPAEQVVHPSRGAAEGYATIHYRRPAGDYGDPTSPRFEDFWGLHVWDGAESPTDWTQPIRPAGQDAFGIEFRVDLADGADLLAYILHRGDTKDPGPDQSLVFANYGHEVWQLQAADPERPYVAPLRR
jgi:Bacterial pullanase-associated domain